MTEALSPLIARLKRSEGWRDKAYLDTAMPPVITIGYGHALAQVLCGNCGSGAITVKPINGISETVGEMLLFSDVAAVMGELEQRLPGFLSLDAIRREVLVELGFNLGVGKVLSFPVFMDQLKRGAYAEAAENMRGWKWVRQVHESRALPLIRMLETGERA